MKHKLILYIFIAVFMAIEILPVYSRGKDLLLKNGNIIPISHKTIMGGDILIKGNKIAKIGEKIESTPNTLVIDLKGKWVIPGIIDSHAHIAIEGGVNEGSESITPEVHIKDVLQPEDYSMFHSLAGGVTTVHTMHGSANPIGGRNVVIKLRWGKGAEELIFKGAPETIKWALGENPKRSNSYRPGRARYPKTRMGVEADIRNAFEKARDYEKAWDKYEKDMKAYKKSKGKMFKPLPPRKNYRLEVISDLLKGKYRVRCHAYQSEEMLSIMKLCQAYNVKLAAFEHGLEGYRITNELVKYGVAITGFADFWGYKWEAFNTLPHNLALMAKRGVLVAINSDSNERMRRLFLDAAKLVRFGGLTELEALKTITINPAIILGIDKYVGTLEVNKDADIAIFNRHPLDPYTVCEMTLVDGKVLFDRTKYHLEREKAAEKKKEKEEKPGKNAKTPKIKGEF